MSMNICGVLVRARPERRAAVVRALEAMPGVEVHAATEDGRIVVTLERAGRAGVADTLSEMHNVEGVLTAALVYEHSETGNETEAEPCD